MTGDFTRINRYRAQGKVLKLMERNYLFFIYESCVEVFTITDPVVGMIYSIQNISGNFLSGAISQNNSLVLVSNSTIATYAFHNTSWRFVLIATFSISGASAAESNDDATIMVIQKQLQVSVLYFTGYLFVELPPLSGFNGSFMTASIDVTGKITLVDVNGQSH